MDRVWFGLVSENREHVNEFKEIQDYHLALTLNRIDIPESVVS
mgnify:CR=1 FL=1